ncbi:IS630 family transposase [Nitrincola tibetensis]|uniref:IS630 family transposase n=1 Tax=Nitrincola tibetensis TaxID=2219697 RepID=A0A364NIM9_9GAMM|nr:IS630 family transposase [Nitrincola tibetensis]RAU16922.1 IS630 family transposase [Nitrincola tibetensis]
MNIDARKLSPEQQEQLRQRAIRLRHEGKSFREIGQLLNVHSDTVGRWYKRYETGGFTAIAVQKRGPKKKQRRLTILQELHIIEAIFKQTPDQFKLSSALWTRRAIAQLIKQLWDIDIPVRTMGDYLKRWGFTPEKPLKNAWVQNPSRINAWLKEEYPKIKARAASEAAEIFWGNETGVNNLTRYGCRYVPVGEALIQPLRTKSVLLNMISATNNQGTVSFMLYKSTMTAKVLNKFLQALIKSTPNKVFLILDNLQVDHANLVKGWLKRGRAKRYLEVFFLPAHSTGPEPG